MKKLRIAMFMSSDPSIAGGVQEHILYLSAHLRKIGHRVSIFGPEGENHEFLYYKKISKIIDIPIPGGNYIYINVLNQPTDLKLLFNKKKYDLIHIHEPNIPSAAWTVIDQLKMPIVTTFHTAWDNESILNFFNGLIPLFKEQFSRIVQSSIFVSAITRARWKEICGPSVYQVIIPNAVDVTSFKPKKRINNILHILFVARLVSRKGVLHLLKAIDILKNKKLQFKVTIIGDGKEKASLINYIKIHKLKKYIHYLGEIKGSKRYKYFTSADVFCAPYINEAASISILEAVSAGLPIVGYPIPIFSDLLKDYPGKELLVKKTDSALAFALEKAILNPSLIQSLKDWCLQKRTSFSWEEVAKQTEEVYYQVLQKYEKEDI